MLKGATAAFLLSCILPLKPLAQVSYRAVDSLKSQIAITQTDSLTSYYHLLLSNIYIERNQLDSCRWAAQYALTVAKKARIPILMAWANHMEGNYYYYEGKFDKALTVQTSVREQAIKLNSPLLLACAKKMIGWIYSEMGKEKEAAILFKESLPDLKKYAKEDFQMNVGIAYYGAATAYYYLNEISQAKLYYDSAVNTQPPMHPRELAFTLADRAALHLNEFKNVKGAYEDVSRAIKIIKPYDFEKDVLAYAKAELALVLATQGKTTAADEEATEALALYQLIPFMKRYASVYRTLSRAFVLSGNYKKAYEVGYQMQILKDLSSTNKCNTRG